MCVKILFQMNMRSIQMKSWRMRN